ncbi:unnamed protein product [Clonostachys rosea]|uniref:Uncharacterized protein n=1 Tax=Bionectria ochroleuca TaxID=29856 RepID=A0ABY6V0Q2_BIOOC|nr:unnamed protein product [Clonostachys rosea]
MTGSEIVPDDQDIYRAFRNTSRSVNDSQAGPGNVDAANIDHRDKEDSQELVRKHGTPSLDKEALREVEALMGDLDPSEDFRARRLAHSGDPECRGETLLERSTRGARVEARLSLRSQYELVVNVQKYLEQACYIYAQKYMPDILQKWGWDCAEAAQLSDWMAEFLDRCHVFGTEVDDRELKHIFQSGIEIRNAAVLRYDMESYETIGLLVDAEQLSKVSANGMEKELVYITTQEAKLEETKKRLLMEVQNSVKNIQEVAGSEIQTALNKARVTLETEIGHDYKHTDP